MLQALYEIKLITRFVRQILPLVDESLSYWQSKLNHFPDDNLKRQALASIRHKRFHAQGGSIYALYPGAKTHALVRFIVALQTISDYLDNLCDRAGCLDHLAFKQLHIAILDALRISSKPITPKDSYYSLYPYQEDGGYLVSLVKTCRLELQNFPNYPLVEKHILKLAGLYNNLQAYKHTYLEDRERLLIEWIKPQLVFYPEISTWEFAAATGSTLGMFMLAAAASQSRLSPNMADRIMEAYFPWICSLHIMLDYLIDQEEDKAEADFNFVAYYKGREECKRRMIFLFEKAKEMALKLPRPFFHMTVIEGLLALYLSDPKALRGDTLPVTEALLKAAGKRTQRLHQMCLLLREKTIIK